MLKLKNNRLTITMEAPGEGYRGSRYDWSSFITSIILDNKHHFTGVESKIAGKGNGGKGLCGEFCMENPPGYDETAVGDYFIKIGVGLVQKAADQEYAFSKPAEVKPILWNVLAKTDQVIFSCCQDMFHGFAYELVKKIHLQENSLVIDYQLTNTGVRDIITHEYNHNYLYFNKKTIGKDYGLSINFDPEFNRKTKGMLYKNRMFTFDENVKKVFFCEDRHACVGKIGSWKLSNNALGLSVTEELSAPIMKFALYGKSYTICPELFADIKAPAGKSFTWQRKWVFEKTDAGNECSIPVIEKQILTDLGKAT